MIKLCVGQRNLDKIHFRDLAFSAIARGASPPLDHGCSVEWLAEWIERNLSSSITGRDLIPAFQVLVSSVLIQGAVTGLSINYSVLEIYNRKKSRRISLLFVSQC